MTGSISVAVTVTSLRRDGLLKLSSIMMPLKWDCIALSILKAKRLDWRMVALLDQHTTGHLFGPRRVRWGGGLLVGGLF